MGDGPCLIIDAAGDEIRQRGHRATSAASAPLQLRSLLVQNFVVVPATSSPRGRSIALGCFDERFRYSMDYDLWLRLARSATRS